MRVAQWIRKPYKKALDFISGFNIKLARCKKTIQTAQTNAEVVELVDTLDLGSSAARRGGSSPLFGTIQLAGIKFDSGFFDGVVS